MKTKMMTETIKMIRKMKMKMMIVTKRRKMNLSKSKQNDNGKTPRNSLSARTKVLKTMMILMTTPIKERILMETQKM